MSRPPRQHLALLSLIALAAVLLPASASAAAPKLRFGIYPGGGVGTVNIVAGEARAENPHAKVAALQRLRGDRAFVLHLYGAWDGSRPYSAFAADIAADVTGYTSAGFDVEPTIRYRPAQAAGAPARFAKDVGALAGQLARDPHVVSIQLTNEANVPGSPDAADGAYPGASEALVRSVVAADRATRRAGRKDIRIGFNWAAGSPRAFDTSFWRQIGRRSTPAFRRALDWVGVDVYPGTWSAPAAAAAGHERDVHSAVRSSLRRLRGRNFRLGRIPRRVALQVSENGFPTGHGRSEAQQVSVMEASVAELLRLRRRYRVTDYRWFDLRDAVSGTGLMENEYGILRDDYSPKAGFGALQTLVQQHGAS